MRRVYIYIFVGLLQLLLIGCGAKTINMFTLQSPTNPPKYKPIFSAIRVDYPKGIEESMGTRIYFSRSKLSQSYYSYSRWSKSLNRIIMAAIIETLQRSGIARNVLDYASEVDAMYELESTIYRFEHKITEKGSYAEISIALRLIRSQNKKLIASKIFNYSIPCTQTDAKGFVEAANSAINRLSIDMINWLSAIRS